MATGYEPNIQGAISVLRDTMVANSITMTREPYDPNYRGLVDAVIDLKEGFTAFVPAKELIVPETGIIDRNCNAQIPSLKVDIQIPFAEP